MRDRFEDLLAAADNYRQRAEYEEWFLEKTAIELRSNKQKDALDVAAEFDRFKKDAVQREEEFYGKFFDFLSSLLKRKYWGKDEDFAATRIDEY